MLTEKSFLPTALTHAARVIQEHFGGAEDEVQGFYDKVLNFVRTDWSKQIEVQLKERIYPSTPPELIQIADYGYDGAHAGIVVHAPELEQEDFPVGYYCELDGLDGVRWVAEDTRDLLKLRLSAAIKRWSTAGTDVDDLLKNGYGKTRDEAEKFAAGLRADAIEDRKKYHALIKHLFEVVALQPFSDAELGAREQNVVYLPPPRIPGSWSYLRTEDNIGVLAPSELFDPKATDDLVSNSDWLRASRQFCRRGYPATALYILKQNAKDVWLSDPERYAILLNEMIAVYEALNRPLLAYAARVTLAGLRKE